MAKIILVEDEQFIANSVKNWLENENHTVDVVSNGDDGLYRLLNYSYDLAILDWQLPGMQGADICRELRAKQYEIPILMLTSRSSLPDRLEGIESGAFDYMVKPASLEELSARVRALLRRITPPELASVIVANLELKKESHEAFVNNEKLALSPIEFQLLELLCENLDRTITADSIVRKLWAGKETQSRQHLRVHMTHLRQKLKSAQCQLVIVSPSGGGYLAQKQSESG